jgi:hypothetical protein
MLKAIGIGLAGTFVVACVALGACSAAQKQVEVGAANAIIQIGVDTCQEAPQIVPAGDTAVVGLVCQLLGSGQTAEVLIDNLIWNSLKASYLQTHATLPAGISSLPSAASARAVVNAVTSPTDASATSTRK